MNLKQRLDARLLGKVVVVGVGKPSAGDDAIGCLVVRCLNRTPHLIPIDVEEVPERYFGHITDTRPDTIMFVDAADMGAAPGAMALFESWELQGSTHGAHRVPMRLLMEYLGRITSADVFLLGIQPERTGCGTAISLTALRSVELLVALIEEVMGVDVTDLAGDLLDGGGEKLSTSA